MDLLVIGVLYLWSEPPPSAISSRAPIKICFRSFPLRLAAIWLEEPLKEGEEGSASADWLSSKFGSILSSLSFVRWQMMNNLG